LFLLNYPDIYK